MPDAAAHSEEYLTDARLDWWRRDHLRSILTEIGCQAINQALDVGVGVGHWSALLFSCFEEPLKLVGLDNEPKWVAASQSYLDRVLATHHYESCLGDVSDIPFSDNTFDLVTCQTVLMHLADPGKAIAEMVRVLKPGGFLIAAEPMNQINRSAVAHGLATEAASPSKLLWDVWRIYHAVQRRERLGDHNIAARLPTLLKAQGELTDIKAYQSDVVTIEGPSHEGLRVLVAELRKPDIRKLMAIGDVTSEDVRKAEIAIETLINSLNRTGELVACPVPNIMFTGRKALDG